MPIPTQIDSTGAGQNNCLISRDQSVNAGYSGPYSFGGNVRYHVLLDLQNFAVRAYGSSDGGQNFTECDAAGAPASASNSGSPHPGTFELLATCCDQANKIIYGVFWSPGFFIAIAPFNADGLGGGTWGAAVISTLDYAFAANLANVGPALCAAFRPADNTVWIGYNRLNSVTVNTGQTIYGAKFAAGSATWDGAPTALAGVLGDSLIWGLAGMATDGGGNIRFNCFNQTILPAGGPPPSTIHLGTIHPDNSLALATVIGPTGGPLVYGQVLQPIFVDPVSNKMGFTFLYGPLSTGAPPNRMNVARALATSDAPAWLIEQPAAIQLPAQPPPGAFAQQAYISTPGLDYIFYGYFSLPLFDFCHIAYITDTGGGWGSETILGTIDESVIDTGNGVNAAPTPLGFGLTITFYAPIPPDNSGVGYWEPIPLLALACPLVNTGTVGVPYSQFLVASGGVPPYSNYHFIGGTLPPGLSIDAGDGLLHGTPTTAGTYHWAAGVSDSVGGVAFIECTTVIAAAPPPSGPVDIGLFFEGVLRIPVN